MLHEEEDRTRFYAWKQINQGILEKNIALIDEGRALLPKYEYTESIITALEKAPRYVIVDNLRRINEKRG